MFHKNILSTLFILLAISVTAFANEPAAEATYKITFKGDWTRANHPTVPLPGPAHFSPLIGAVHNESATVWKKGDKATEGFTLVAELGQNGKFRKELKAQKGKSISALLEGSGNIDPTAKDVIKNVRATKSHHLVSLATMIAPSHDWFIGVSNLSLMENGTWKDKIKVDLYAYDAGTELGDDFKLGPDRAENGVIHKLKGVSHIKNYKFGSLLIERVN